MVFLIGLLTLVMVLDCVILVFLVLIQLPKKEAGAGLAFGAGATDALFGAGSGTVLTKITKYAAGTFFVLAVILSVLQSHYHTRSTSAFESKLSGAAPAAPAPQAAGPSAPNTFSSPSNVATPPAASTNVFLSAQPTGAPPLSLTNAAPTNVSGAPTGGPAEAPK